MHLKGESGKGEESERKEKLLKRKKQLLKGTHDDPVLTTELSWNETQNVKERHANIWLPSIQADALQC